MPFPQYESSLHEVLKVFSALQKNLDNYLNKEGANIPYAERTQERYNDLWQHCELAHSIINRLEAELSSEYQRGYQAGLKAQQSQDKGYTLDKRNEMAIAIEKLAKAMARDFIKFRGLRKASIETAKRNWPDLYEPYQPEQLIENKQQTL